MRKLHPQSIPSTEYTYDYFVNCCDGHDHFTATRGQTLPPRLRIPLELGNIGPDMRVVDIGCGRGEIVLHCARRGASVWGLDYAAEAIALASEALDNVATPQERTRIMLLRGNARVLPFDSNSIDVLFMLDVVEHLYPTELVKAVGEAKRILRPNGRVVIHTMPNLWYYHYGYPLYRAIQRMRGERLPANPRARWEYSHVHVNEQTPISLYRTLHNAGFDTKVWLQSTQSYDYESNTIVRFGMNMLTRVLPLRWIFCNDIFAIGITR